jgi:peptidoglycan/xylan/chitin deacetylase (PgdA/CDA1 family)
LPEVAPLVRSTVARVINIPLCRGRSYLRRRRVFPPRTLHDLYPEHDRRSAKVALTFDDGPDPDWTVPILEVLRRHRVKATFFVCGASVERWPDLLRRIVDEGHAVGGHGYTHRPLPTLERAEIVRELDDTHDLIERVCDVQVRMMRPPYGAHDAKVLAELESRDLTPVLWTAHGYDWVSPSPSGSRVKQTVLSTTTRNGIVLLHDGAMPTRVEPGADLDELSRLGTVEGVDAAIPRLLRRGLDLVPLVPPAR